MQRMVGWVAVYPGLGLPGTRGHFGQTQPDGCYRGKDQVFFLLRSWAEGRCFAERLSFSLVELNELEVS